jgi:putative sigma-54 modulation protein
MKIDIVGRNLEITPAIRQYAEAKVDKLTRHFDRIQEVVFTVGKESHHKQGEYSVELRVDVEGHDDFVSHEKHPDLYAAVDAVVDKGVRQLTQHKEKLKNDHRH